MRAKLTFTRPHGRTPNTGKESYQTLSRKQSKKQLVTTWQYELYFFVKVHRTLMRCPQCQTKNSPGSLLCSRCGAALNAQSATPNQTAFDAPPSGAVSLDKSAPLSGVPVQEGAPYKASGIWNAPGLFVICFAGLVSALVVGLLYHFVSQWFNLIIVFPLIAGALVGFGIALAVTKANIRNPKLVGTVAVVAGLLMLGTMHLARAWSLRGPMIDDFTTQLAAEAPQTKIVGGKEVALSPAELGAQQAQIRSRLEKQATPLAMLLIYEESAAEVGTTIGRPGSGGGIPIKGVFYWLLRGTELLLVVLASAAIASGAAGEPFCEGCKKWQEDKTVMKIHPAQNALLAQSIAARDWNGLMDTPQGAATDEKNITTVKVTRCPSCNTGTLSATSLGAPAPPEFSRIVIAPTSTQTILAKANSVEAPGTA